MHINFNENLQVAWIQLKSSKLRSILTTMGITIGIATVIFIVAILEGYMLNISEELQGLGANVFQVQKYEASAGIRVHGRQREVRKNIERQYAEEIRDRCSAVKFCGAEVWTGGQSYRYKDKKTNPSFVLAGGEPEFFYNNNLPIGRGRIISRSDVVSSAKVVVIGKDIVDELFPFEEPLGKFMKISGIKFKIIGIFEDFGTQTFGRTTNNRAAIPITTFEDIYGKYRSVNLTIMANDASQIDDAKSQVIGVMRQLRKIPPGEENNFAMWSNESLTESFQNTAEMIQLVAIMLGMISLLVGSIGVMNIMLVTVTERTREIGVRKAVGAKRQAILVQFLNESVFLSLIGGFLGIVLGFSLAFLVTSIFDMPFAVPLWSVITGLAVTTLVGLFAGIYPAAKASKLDPIEALRYE
jgi:putative ABC transport system permease protein